MNVYVGERAQPVSRSALGADPLDLALDGLEAARQLRRRDEWRWIPDAGEADIPTTSTEDEPRLSAAVIRALAWASLHY